MKLTAAQRTRARKAGERDDAAAAAAAAVSPPSPAPAMFASASSRPLLPPALVYFIAAFLPVRDLVQGLALVCGTAYHTMREYAAAVQQHCMSDDLARAGLHGAAAASLVFSRTDPCSFASSPGVAELLQSRLRGVVTGIVLPVAASSHEFPGFPLDVTLVAQIATSMSGLHRLQCGLSAPTDGPQWIIALPPRLRSLSVHVIRFGGCASLPGLPRLTAASLVSAGWPAARCLAFSVAVASAIAELPCLTDLAFEPVTFGPTR